LPADLTGIVRAGRCFVFFRSNGLHWRRIATTPEAVLNAALYDPVIWRMALWKFIPRTWTKKSIALPAWLGWRRSHPAEPSCPESFGLRGWFVCCV